MLKNGMQHTFVNAEYVRTHRSLAVNVAAMVNSIHNNGGMVSKDGTVVPISLLVWTTNDDVIALSYPEGTDRLDMYDGLYRTEFNTVWFRLGDSMTIDWIAFENPLYDYSLFEECVINMESDLLKEHNARIAGAFVF